MCIYRGYQIHHDTMCYVIGASFGISAIIAGNTLKHIWAEGAKCKYLTQKNEYYN